MFRGRHGKPCSTLKTSPCCHHQLRVRYRSAQVRRPRPLWHSWQARPRALALRRLLVMSCSRRSLAPCRAMRLPAGKRARSSHRSRSSIEGETEASAEAPETFWKPDNAAPACDCCSLPFTFRRRRHHCRLCGAPARPAPRVWVLRFPASARACSNLSPRFALNFAGLVVCGRCSKYSGAVSGYAGAVRICGRCVGGMSEGAQPLVPSIPVSRALRGRDCLTLNSARVARRHPPPRGGGSVRPRA